MQARIQKYGGLRQYIANLILLGILGALLIRLLAFTLYTFLPTDYFLDYVQTRVEEDVYNCRTDGVQKIPVHSIRHVYPHMPEDIAKRAAIEASVTDELIRTNTGHGDRKIDDQHFTPAYEWKPEGHNDFELEFKTHLIPGTYRVDSTIIIKLPYIGEKKPIHIQTNTFNVLPCNE